MSSPTASSQESREFLEKIAETVFSLDSSHGAAYLARFEALEKRVAKGFRLDPQAALASFRPHERIYSYIPYLNPSAQTRLVSLMREVGALSLFEAYKNKKINLSRFIENIALLNVPDLALEIESAKSLPNLNIVLAYHASLDSKYKRKPFLEWFKERHPLPKKLTLSEIGEALLFSPEKQSRPQVLLEFIQQNRIKIIDDQCNAHHPVLLLNTYRTESIRALAKLGFAVERKSLEQLFANYRPTTHLDLRVLCEVIQEKNPVLLKKWIRQPDRLGKGVVAVHQAAKYRDLESLKILKAAGADLKAKDNAGNTVVHYAMIKYSAKHEQDLAPTLSWLRAQGLNLEEKNNRGESPMNKLSKQGTIESLMTMVDLLGSQGLKEENNEGKTALDLIENRRDRDIMKPLTEKVLLNDVLSQTPSDPVSHKPKKRL